MGTTSSTIRTPAGRWALTGVVTVALGVPFTLLGVPAAGLFAALVAAAGLAVAGLAPRSLPRVPFLAVQAVLGVLIGALVSPDALGSLADDWAPIVLVSLATLLLTLLAGSALGMHRDVDPLTGSLALVAGGASGLTAISRELGADDRLVAVVQYLRVVVVVAVMPAVTALVFRAETTGAVAVDGPRAPWWLDLALVAGCSLVGVPLALLARLPAGGLLGPMLLSAVVSGFDLLPGTTAPTALVTVAFAVIGWQAGLGFTRESLRVLRRVLAPALGLIVAVIVACAGLGLVLSAVSGASLLDGYLATTPGGVYAVLAVSAAAGGNVTFVLAVQLLRVFLMLLAAPALSRFLAGRGDRRRDGRAPG